MSAAAFFDAARALKRELTGNTAIGVTQAEVDALNAVIGAWQPLGMAWGAKVSETFRERVRWLGKQLGVEPGDLMACMAWESGRTFSPSVKNMAGSGATGLIQFMPSTAQALGTTTDELAAMTAEDQLNYVFKYFEPYKGRLHGLSDVYMAILYPRAVGQPDDFALFTSGIAYRQNAGLDTNEDGRVTKAECAAKLYAIRAEGLRPENVA